MVRHFFVLKNMACQKQHEITNIFYFHHDLLVITRRRKIFSPIKKIFLNLMNLNSRKQWLKTSKNAYSKLVLEFLNAAAPICRLLQMCKYDVNLAQCTLYSTLSLKL